MKITIKKFQTMRSSEGRAFSYDLYLDGVRAAFVCDEGTGGGIYPRWYDQKQGVISELAKKLDAYVAALPPEPMPADAEDWQKTMYTDGFRQIETEDFLCRLADEHEHAKRMKRICAKKTVFRLPTDKKDEYRTVAKPFSPQIKAWVLAKYPNAEILNEVIS